MKLINKRICAGVTSLAITATILNSMPITSRKDANIYAKAVESKVIRAMLSMAMLIVMM